MPQRNVFDDDKHDGGTVTFPAILVVAAVWAVLAYLVLFDAAVARWRRERDELARVGGRVDTTPRVPPPPIRRDPSPLPRGRVLDRDRGGVS